ncbi:synaptotagmin-like protein 2 [Pangasianodon hypophthalmus]|uniref:synaptotagmin-like protein 2 n=1 Tax=Pangasianodon hypophthalmus TaxID=310915 RepID=UPI0023074E03|nr:synaptotagmin-like protein 2 [Pangasianodon hypophthalmus]XP_053093761.1 synaptotagmin-like protein 2 [Pangasianodon hypophthalmus]
MKASRDTTIFIDLSFLSPEEEAIIQNVLLRDEDLKKNEIGRVRKLRETVPDSKELKVLSGEWFEDLKSKRYGRQPHASAIVRSSMRWKKSAGHKPNPFLKAVPEDKDVEKNKPCPDVSADPRSIHPALSVQVQQENKDEAVILEESSGAKLNTPVLKVIEAGRQSGAKLQDQTPRVESLKLEPVQESKTKATITKEINTEISDPGRTALKEDRGVETSLDTRPKQRDGSMPRNFKIRSFSKAQETTNWEIHQLGSDDESNKPQSNVEVVINSNNSTETEVTNKQNNATPEVLMNSGFGVKEKIQTPIPKKRSNEGIRVMNITNKRTTPTRTEELSVDLNVKEDPGILGNLKIGPVNNVNTPECINSEQKTLDPVQKGKERVVEEIIVADFKQRSPTRTEELSVDLDVKRNSDILEGPFNSVNTTQRVNVDQSLDPVQKGKERVVEEIIVADFKRRSPTRTKEVSVDLDVEKDPDLLEGPVNNVNTAKRVNWDQKSFDPVQKGKEQAVEEIIVTDFKRRSPTRTKELSVDLNVEANPDIVEDLKTGPVHTDVHKDENRSADMNRDELPESVVKNKKNEAAGGKSDFDVELRKLESTNQKVSKEIEEISETEQEGSFQDREDESGISESGILASVYARATRPKSGVSKTPFAKDPMQKTVDVIPTIVIVPSESEEPTEMERVKNETPAPEALVEVEAKPGTDIWEDEGVDSDEDSSSASSHDSDLSGKRDKVSASTLSVAERTASLLSVYSDAGDFGNVTVQGSVEFAIMYSPLGELVIMVEQCQDLAIANPRKQRTDPYVKTYLYPDKRSKRKTSIKKRTVNPVFVESLRYKVKREELHGKTLNLSVWHNDSRGRNSFLGQVEINLKDWDWKHEALTWYNLQPKSADNQESQEYRGVLSVSLKYVPPEATGGSRLSRPMGEIHIWLRDARHLRRLKAQGVDSFVKCYMLPDTSKKSRQKTRVVKKTQDPVYNHTMVYDGFRTGEVSEACCELTVWDNNKLSNQFLGGVRLSLGTGQSYGKKVDWMDSENEEVEIWKKMIATPNSWVEAELPLRSSMTPRK